MSDDLLAELDGRLWHATNEHGLAGILAKREIRPDATPIYAKGFCRSIGGISLFDLSQPDSAASPAAAHWSAWLGLHDEGPRFWFEVDRVAAAPHLLDPTATLTRWREAQEAHSPSLRIISGLEAAHIGPIPLDHIVRVLRVDGRVWVPIEI